MFVIYWVGIKICELFYPFNIKFLARNHQLNLFIMCLNPIAKGETSSKTKKISRKFN